MILGLIANKGIWSIVGGISLMWLGGGISGYLRGELHTTFGHFTSSVKRYKKDREPKTFWVQVFFEIGMGILIFFIFLKSPYE